MPLAYDCSMVVLMYEKGHEQTPKARQESDSKDVGRHSERLPPERKHDDDDGWCERRLASRIAGSNVSTVIRLSTWNCERVVLRTVGRGLDGDGGQ